MNDLFNKWFKKFSTEHPWYKTAHEQNFYFIPQNKIEYPWTLHLSYVLTEAPEMLLLPPQVKKIIQSYPVRINGLVYGNDPWRLKILFGDGGWSFIDYIKKKYIEAATILQKYVRDNNRADDPRYKILFYYPRYCESKCKNDIHVLNKMIECEYERMQESARKQYYKMIVQIYQWIRLQLKKSQEINYGELTCVAMTYRFHILQIQKELLLLLQPKELVEICIGYHDIF